MKKTLNKIIKITNVTIYATWIIWTLFVCVSYGVAWVASPSYSNLRMNEMMTYVNFVVNSTFFVNLVTDVIYKYEIKKVKASD